MGFIEFILSNRFEVGALMVVVCLWLVVEIALIKRKGKTISSHELIKMMNHDNALLIDVRTEKEFSTGHIRDSVRLDPKQIKDQLDILDKTGKRPLVFLCQYGVKAGHAAQSVFELAPERVYRLKGGIVAWQTDNLPLQQGRT